LLSIAAVGSEYLHIVVPISSDIRDLSDLAGKRVATGIEGTGSRLTVERIIATARFDPPVRLISMTHEMFRDQVAKGKIDAAMFVSDLRGDVRPGITEGQYRLVGVRASEALALSLFDVKAANIPVGIYGKNLSFPSEALPTLSVRSYLLVRRDVPNSGVRRLTETLFDYHVRRDAELPELTEQDARAGVELTLHPAADKFYSRNEPITSDKFEIAGVLLAILISVLSAFNFFWRWYNTRR
jgi:hypothetical protein